MTHHFLLRAVLVLLLTGHVALADVPLEVTNPGFEDWAPLAQVDPLWNLQGGAFPVGWTPESYRGVPSLARPAPNSPDEASRHGRRCLYLDGQIVSARVRRPLATLLNSTVLVAVRARGAGGQLRVALRGYADPPDERLRYQAELLQVSTGEQWRTYSDVVLLYHGNGMREATIELEGHGVFVDEVQLTALDQAPTGTPLEVTLPVVAAEHCPTVDGAFSVGEWEHATWLTGFANLSTASLALRQGRVGLLSEGQRLFLCARWPSEYGTAANVTARDGEVWRDDALEVYLGPPPGGAPDQDLHQLVVNSRGTLFDQRWAAGTRQSDATWSSAAVLASRVAAGWWTLEIAIPLAEAGVGQDGAFGLQLCRDFRSPAEYTSITGGPFQTLFPCRLSPAAPALNWTLGGDLASGAVSLNLTVSNPTAQPLAGRASLSVAGAESRQAQQPFSLAPGAAASVALDLADRPVTYGRFTLEVVPDQGEPLLHQQFTLNTTEFVSRYARPVPPRRVEFYPVQGKLNVRLTGLTEADRARYQEALIEVRDGERILKQARVAPPVWAGTEAHFALPFAPPDDREYTARAVICDGSGNVVDSLRGTCQRSATPWLGNKLGLAPVVLPGLPPLRAQGRTLSVWGREYALGATGFPAALTSAGGPVLAGPIRLLAVDASGGRRELAAAGSGVTLSGKTDTEILLNASLGSGALTAALSGTMVYDGFLEYRLQFGPRVSAGARQLSLEIPLTTAKYLHCVRDSMRENSEWLQLPDTQGLLWDSARVPSRTTLGSFVPYLWVGDEQRGLAWFADNDRGWRPDPQRPCLELVRAGRTVALRINFLSGSGQVSPGTIHFGLGATPVRPTPVAPQHKFTINYFGFDNPVINAYSQGLTSRDPYLARQILAPRRAAGQSAQVYLANEEMPSADPVSKAMYYEWAHSGFAFYSDALALLKTRVYGPDPANYVAFQNCCTPSRVDYNLSCLDRLLDLGLSGMYMDNSYPYACRNVQHPACGFLRPDGQLQAGYNLFNTRSLIRRAATLSSQKQGVWPWISVHTTGAMVIPCFSFADLCIDGEDHPQLDTAQDFMDLWPLERVALMGAVNWGPMRGWLPKLHFAEAYTAERPTRTLLAELKLFDMWIWPAHCNTTLLQKLLDIEKSCGLANQDTQFLGYWQNEGYVKPDHPEVRASFYVRPGKVALLYVSNFSRQDVETALKLDLSHFGLAGATLTDAETGAPVPREGPICRLKIPWHDFRMLQATP